jgi:hypothetical protein
MGSHATMTKTSGETYNLNYSSSEYQFNNNITEFSKIPNFLNEN